MFGLTRTVPFADPQFGELNRSRSLWRGVVQFDSGPVPLAIRGSRRGPDPSALAATREAVQSWPDWRPLIAAALFEHYEGYKEAAEYSGEEFPVIAAADDVWAYVTCEFVAVAGYFDVLRFWTPLGFRLTTEIGLKTEWDEEHTLAARFVDGHFMELCASVPPP